MMMISQRYFKIEEIDYFKGNSYRYILIGNDVFLYDIIVRKGQNRHVVTTIYI